MHRNTNSLIMMILFLFSASYVIASDSVEMNSMSNAMLTFLGCAAMALSVTYLFWRYRNSRSRMSNHKITNRPPVKRSTVYYRRKVMHSKG